jgi:NAD-dependent deacetylase
MNVSDFKRIVFFTGAGMSAESGVPTYRGHGGVWTQYNYEDYACQRAFDRDPKGVWEFHDRRRQSTGACRPHSGHALIAALEQRRSGVTVVTQNIDGMHQRAGSKTVFELHGSMWRLRCDACGIVVDNLDVPLGTYQHECGNWWRPDIVWFGDMLRPDTVQRAQDAISTCDLLVSIGTSAVVYPAAQFPLLARQTGAKLVEINLEETPLSSAYDLCLRGSASAMLAKLFGEGCAIVSSAHGRG